MMNIYWFELYLTVMQGDIRDTGEGGGGNGESVEELGKHLPFVIVIGVQKTCSLLNSITTIVVWYISGTRLK